MNYARAYPRFWLVYFVVAVALTAGNLAYDIVARFGSLSAMWLLGTLVGVIGLQPLYGYVRQRRYDPRWLWKTLFVICVAGTSIAALICLFMAVSKLSIIPLLAAASFVLLGGPYLLALHQYVYRSPHLWTPGTD